MNNKVKGLAGLTVGLGVLVAGGLLGPDGARSADHGWKTETASGGPGYAGPEPVHADVLQDLGSATESAGVGPAMAGDGVVNASECVAARNHSVEATDTRMTVIVDRLADRGWRVTQRRSSPAAVALFKGAWNLVVADEAPSGTPVLSLIAIHDIPACKEQLAAP
ncbi:hypothetical protein ACFWA6_19545 [Streptomyces sp. NPDC060020]|uniref:hypothetical protein n=1 Tax=Streptomyces sp. NPDC060020 TaxID=3347038 RepID=UPI0036853B55